EHHLPCRHRSGVLGIVSALCVDHGGCPVDGRLPLVLVGVTEPRRGGSLMQKGGAHVAVGRPAGRAGASTRRLLGGSLRDGGVVLCQYKPLAGYAAGRVALALFLQLVNPHADRVKAQPDLIPAAVPRPWLVIRAPRLRRPGFPPGLTGLAVLAAEHAVA